MIILSESAEQAIVNHTVEAVMKALDSNKKESNSKFMQPKEAAK